MAESGVKFSSRWGFMLAAMGSAVGLGNIWRFTFMAGENGGGAFIFFYFLFIILLGIPCVIAMITIGRRGGRSPAGSTEVLARAEGASANWKYLGWIAISIAFLALTFFSVVAGWVLAYLPISLSGAFAGISAEGSVALFNEVQASVWGMTFWHGVFMALTMWVVARGVQNGVEKTVKIMMPALFVILLTLVLYAAVAGDFRAALTFMFVPDFSRVSNDVVLLALGQAFFSLSVGGGGILNYGSYLDKQASIPRSAFASRAPTFLSICSPDWPFSDCIRLCAGAGRRARSFVCNPAGGAGPNAGGLIVGTLFLLLVLFAALSTSISMLESTVSRLVEKPGAIDFG